MQVFVGTEKCATLLSQTSKFQVLWHICEAILVIYLPTFLRDKWIFKKANAHRFLFLVLQTWEFDGVCGFFYSFWLTQTLSDFF